MSEGAHDEMYKRRLFSFDMILKVNTFGVQKILAAVDAVTIATALKNASPEITELVMKNVSKRVQELIREDMEVLGALTVPEIEIAQAQQSTAREMHM